MPRIFVDMDGVLADFDGHYIATIGPLPDRSDPTRDVDWSKIDAANFFASIPPMPDALELWGYVGHLYGGAVILTGCPKSGRERAEQNKRAWILRHLGAGIEIRTVLSREKAQHCQPGDILIDDWEKYRSLWERAGGVWITHRSAAETIDHLADLGHGL